jgi:nucleoid DNA-binding protein
MTKKDIAQVVAQRADVSAATAEEVLGAALDVIGEQLAKGEDVRLPGFGTFETRQRAARTGRNPQTGEEISIAASTAVGFKAAAQLKRAVNG